MIAIGYFSAVCNDQADSLILNEKSTRYWRFQWVIFGRTNTLVCNKMLLTVRV